VEVGRRRQRRCRERLGAWQGHRDGRHEAEQSRESRNNGEAVLTTGFVVAITVLLI